jgi:hypothetical protein
MNNNKWSDFYIKFHNLKLDNQDIFKYILQLISIDKNNIYYNDINSLYITEYHDFDFELSCWQGGIAIELDNISDPNIQEAYFRYLQRFYNIIKYIVDNNIENDSSNNIRLYFICEIKRNIDDYDSYMTRDSDIIKEEEDLTECDRDSLRKIKDLVLE